MARKNSNHLWSDDTYDFNSIKNIVLDKEMLKTFSANENINIYVYEDYVRYIITYYTEPAFDSKKEQNVMMAEIAVDVQGVDHAVVKKFELLQDGSYAEINP